MIKILAVYEQRKSVANLFLHLWCQEEHYHLKNTAYLDTVKNLLHIWEVLIVCLGSWLNTAGTRSPYSGRHRGVIFGFQALYKRNKCHFDPSNLCVCGEGGESVLPVCLCFIHPAFRALNPQSRVDKRFLVKI